MKRKYLNALFSTAVVLFGMAFMAFGQSNEIPKDLYVASTIPDSLKENANSVVRYSEIIKTVKGPGKVEMRVHTIITVLNEKADGEGVLSLGYNRKFDNVSSIELRVYDDKGVLVKKYHKSDMYDGAASESETLVTDDRFLAVKHTIAAYPATIEKEYEYTINSLLDLGSWDIQDNEQAVQNSYFQLSIDANAGFRYRNKNTNIKPDIKATDAKTAYLWKVANLKAVKLEEGAEDWRVFPRIDFASNKFEFCGYPGDFSNWKSYGLWQKALNADVCSLTPEREAEIKKMTDSIKTDKAKVRYLYNYMQQNVRYVNIKLGIGGLKPLPATFVDQKKYGDCKALSNYMSALLKAVNIPSYFTMINAGPNEEPADPSFPFDPFNHVILCVPLKGDTTWLECTVNTQQFGKLGPFTENRTALAITEDGGRLINTPHSTMQDNQFDANAHLTLNADGSAKASLKILSTGGYRDEYIGVASFKLDDQKEFFLTRFNIKQPSVFELKPASDKDGVKEVDLNLEYDKFCDIIAGDKQFYRPRVFDLIGFTLPVEEKRKADYYFEHPIQKSCVTTIDLPAGFEVETLPVNQSLKFTYGNYEVKYVYDPAKNQVVSTAKFNLVNHVVPAEKYAEMQQYMDAVAKAQNKKLVIKRKA